MLTLSVIIVSYNAPCFLEQCLYSVKAAVRGISAEVIIIDNDSPDRGIERLPAAFPEFQFILNKENTGYARANNQGWRQAKGRYILFLNPDTILSEDALQLSIEKMESDSGLGALGIHMLDGNGDYLPESKRGFPLPAASLFKLSGLIWLFPRSKSIAHYYLGHLPEKQDNEVDVLSGAYMMVRKEVLAQTSGFDEQFFMYGEDIDLSYRIKEAGYRNYYLTKTSIIHFKGKSTLKDIAYTKLFYRAMNLFIDKHYGHLSAFSRAALHSAIFFGRANASILAFFRPHLNKAKPEVKPQVSLVIGPQGQASRIAHTLTARRSTQRMIRQVNSIEESASALAGLNPDEIIFCAGPIHYRNIIAFIQAESGLFNYKIFAEGSNSLVGEETDFSESEIIIAVGENAGRA